MLAYVDPFFLPIFPLFLFSLITYFMREEVFRTWWNFTRWFFLFTMLLILVTPTDYGGSGIGLSFGKPDVAFLASLVFIVVSTILITWKWFSLRGEEMNLK